MHPQRERRASVLGVSRRKATARAEAGSVTSQPPFLLKGKAMPHENAKPLIREAIENAEQIVENITDETDDPKLLIRLAQDAIRALELALEALA